MLEYLDNDDDNSKDRKGRFGRRLRSQISTKDVINSEGPYTNLVSRQEVTQQQPSETHVDIQSESAAYLSPSSRMLLSDHELMYESYSFEGDEDGI